MLSIFPSNVTSNINIDSFSLASLACDVVFVYISVVMFKGNYMRTLQIIDIIKKINTSSYCTSWRPIYFFCICFFICSYPSVLKTCLEGVFKTFWRQTKCLLGLSVWNKSKCVSNKSIFHKSISGKSKANPKCIN